MMENAVTAFIARLIFSQWTDNTSNWILFTISFIDESVQSQQISDAV